MDLIDAATKGDLRAVSELLAKGAVVDLKEGKYGRTALMRAVGNNHLNIVKILIEKGADVNARDHDGDTSLTIASSDGHVEVVKELLENGADVNARNSSGESSLWKACFSVNTEVAEILLEKGADANAKDSKGQSSLMLASKMARLAGRPNAPVVKMFEMLRDFAETKSKGVKPSTREITKTGGSGPARNEKAALLMTIVRSGFSAVSSDVLAREVQDRFADRICGLVTVSSSSGSVFILDLTVTYHNQADAQAINGDVQRFVSQFGWSFA